MWKTKLQIMHTLTIRLYQKNEKDLTCNELQLLNVVISKGKVLNGRALLRKVK